MPRSLFVGERLHTPYHIFIRTNGELSDRELLGRLGLGNYQPARSDQRPRDRYTILADDGRWTMVADDWFYTLWNSPSTRPALASLAEEADLFACSFGDCDYSFDFVYYREGQLVRKYVFDDPWCRGGQVVEDVGERLPGEPASFVRGDEYRPVLGIATALGIRTDYAEQDIRVYASPEPMRWGLAD